MAENNTTYYQSRHTGTEIDNLLDQSIAATAAANASSEKADEAAENANNEVAKIPGMVAGKADLDPETGCVPAMQIAPLQGRQTSVQMGDGRFQSDASALCIDGDKTIAVCFRAGTERYRVGYIFHDHASSEIANGLMIRIGYNGIVSNFCGNNLFAPSVVAGALYLAVITIRKDIEAIGYLNGLAYSTVTDHSRYTAPNVFLLGALFNGRDPLDGQIIGARLFNYALSASEAAELWNGGAPERYMLPPSGAMRAGLVAEYIPAGLLADRWRDTSGAGLDLPYVPTTAGGTTELDYQQPPISPSGSPMHDLFVAAGAVWDNATKRWMYAGLSDISMEEMLQMYAYIGVSGGDVSYAYSQLKARTNFPPLNRDTALFNTSECMCDKNSTIEIFNIANVYATLYNVNNMFRNAVKLRQIRGTLVMTNITNAYGMFMGCVDLVDVYILNLKCNLSLSDSPLISAVRVKYIVDNALTSGFPISGITVTVHADVYAKLTDPTNTEWYAINAAAQAKKISFATA